MAEYWKSTPKYWCKHCSVYVRDTKLERQNHDATAKHQGAVKRALRDLHRGHEKEEREKDRAKREIERLNGVVAGASGSGTTAAASSSSSSSSTHTSSAPGTGANATPSRFGGPRTAPAALPESERKRQAEQLASLGVSLPEEFRRDLAMAGDWQVTSTTIVQDKLDDSKTGAIARGVHKRERTEEELEEEEAVKGLFKKPRRWGRDSRTVGGEGAGPDLDALLSGGLTVKRRAEEEGEEEGEEDGKVKKEKKEEEHDIKKEDDSGPSVRTEEEHPPIKEEPSDEAGLLPAQVPTMATAAPSNEDASAKLASPGIKTEVGDGAPELAGGVGTPAVVFKKRKPKNIRQK
ncbi:hypothetical protein VP1G_06329 [Cytospora mali]|uniref:U1-type domain-containing protein n=1 Tax=Cytospora mali TaxID=578113 RepID=A0A194V5C8_CYTMA|nr:hypothetical protein VP1G_06329 [Valsa mali var. pyri (nom. inval.)]